MTKRSVLVLGVVAAVSLGIILAFPDTVREVTDLYPGDAPAHPYFVPAHAGLVYVKMPLVVLAAVITLVAPGILLILAFGRANHVSELLLKGFLAAFLLHFLTFTLLKLVSSGPPSLGAFRLLLVASVIGAWGMLALRAVHGWGARGAPSGLVSATDQRRALWAGAICVLALLLLLPLLFWQDLNPDGLEALTTGRSLTYHVLPRLPNGKAPGLNLGMVSMAYPIHWFIALFGHVDAAARLPLVLYLPLLFAGIIALIELRSPRQLTAFEESVVVLGLATFAATLSFNDTYHLYSADVASPANIDILAVAGMLGIAYFLWVGEWAWCFLFVMLTHLTRPTGLMFLGLLAVGIALTAPDQLRSRLPIIVIGIALCVGWTATYEWVISSVAGIRIHDDSLQIAARLRYLRFDDVNRFLYLLVPTGILPSVALATYRRQDEIGRTLTFATLGYFALFYVIAFTALHQFAPVMVLPVVVFWRWVVQRGPSRPLLVATVAASALSLVLALPRSFTVDRSMRAIGRETAYLVGDYAGDYAAYRAAYEERTLLLSLFRPFWDVNDPSREMMGSPWVHIHYSAHRAVLGPEINYLVQPSADPPPEGFTRVAADAGAAVYVRDLERWGRDRYSPPRTDFRSGIYDIPRETLFAVWGIRAQTYALDIRALLGGLKRRLGRVVGSASPE